MTTSNTIKNEANEYGEPQVIAPAGRYTASGEFQHQSSHLDLLNLVPRYAVGLQTPRATLSAVVVPTSRSQEDLGAGLGLAARIAAMKDAQLVIIRSGEASLDPFPRELLPSSSHPTLVLDLPAEPDELLPPWQNGRHIVATLHRRSDLGLKRNIALLLGRRVGWDTVLMLDDDISTNRASQLPPHDERVGVDPPLRLDDVLAEFHEYPQVRAAGYVQKDFDDNSVVCHIRRLSGRPQEGFISGGALVVRCQGRLPFFPATYNEDWLFFFALMLQGHHVLPSSTVRLAGTVHQSAYYPYSAKRAQSEELGDVLAEGLFALVGMPLEDVATAARSKDYWGEVVWRRQNMIIALLREHRQKYPETVHSVLADVDESLRASLAIYEGSVERWGISLAQYIRTLLVDLELWDELLAQVSPPRLADASSLADALGDVGLTEYATWLPSFRRPHSRSSVRSTSSSAL